MSARARTTTANFDVKRSSVEAPVVPLPPERPQMPVPLDDAVQFAEQGEARRKAKPVKVSELRRRLKGDERKITFTCPQELVKPLKIYCVNADRTMAHAMETALREYLQRNAGMVQVMTKAGEEC